MLFWRESQALEVQVECYVIWHFRIQRILRKYLFHLQCHECVTTKVCPKNATEAKKQHQPMQKCILRTFTQESMYDDSKSTKRTPCLIFACFSTWTTLPAKSQWNPKETAATKKQENIQNVMPLLLAHICHVCANPRRKKNSAEISGQIIIFHQPSDWAESPGQ